MTSQENTRKALQRIAQARALRLARVDLSAFDLTRIPEELKNLDDHLTSIDLKLNSIRTLPAWISKFQKIRSIDLSNNKIVSFPTQITELTELTTLSLNNNKLTSLPKEIRNLQKIKILSLGFNHLQTLPTEIGNLKDLRLLSLEDNQLSSLPKEITLLRNLETLYLFNNSSLHIPPEIFNYSPKAIFDYYFRSQREETRPLLEAKLLLVGQGGVGKTSLVSRLVHDSYNPSEQQTDGIRITEWTTPGRDQQPVKLNIWDFGGQEIMHSTHQFFLTQRSIYLIVLEARKSENDGNLRPWLRAVLSSAGNSPILVVLNKWEGSHRLDLDEGQLLKDFAPNLRGFVRTSCYTGHGIKLLKRATKKLLVELDHIYDPLPQTYFQVKEELRSRTKEDNYITVSEYRKLCGRRDLGGTEPETLLGFLHDLGIVLNFSDPRYRHLRDPRILNPEWVTQGVYNILTHPDLGEAQGVLNTTTIGRALKAEQGYPREHHSFILDMMRKFELCFDILGEPGQYLVPQLLPKSMPGDFVTDETGALRFEYSYSHLPPGVIPRFIVRMKHALGDTPTYWRSGAVVIAEKSRSLVRGDLDANRVFVTILGPPGGRPRRALTIIRDAFRAIHQSISGQKPEERVPLPDDPSVTVSYQHLLRLEEYGQNEHFPDGARRPYKVIELLEGVASQAQRATDRRTFSDSLRRMSGTSTYIEKAIFEGRKEMGDKYINKGSAAAFGKNVDVKRATASMTTLRESDITKFMSELARLKAAMQREASEPEHYQDLAIVAQAEADCGSGDSEGAIAKLATGSKWLADKTADLGVELLATIITKGAAG